jgi:serine/threonine-protein kinase HipA
VRSYCQGLLPDNESVLERWGREFQVSAGNPFALLSHVGEDCAGAAQFVAADRVGALLAHEGAVKALTEERVADRLRTLRRDPSAWHLAGTGQFSLAGAQAKTALHFDATEGWGDPVGAVPTTHILKPAIAGFDDHDLNEHLCLRTAHLLGLRAAFSRVHSFGVERAVVVERYDRLPIGAGRVARIHQEDMCQALGLPPTAKYQSEGGPSAEQIIAVLPRLRLAMKIGSEYRVAAITGKHWRAFAERNRLDPGRVLERIAELARRLPAAIREAASADAVVALGSSLPERMVARITEHADRCLAALEKSGN